MISQVILGVRLRIGNQKEKHLMCNHTILPG
jgi:hypothetical protein